MTLRNFVPLIIAFLCLVTAPSYASDSLNWGYGPIELRNQYPLHLLHFSFAPSSPRVLVQGITEFRTPFSWSNTLNRKSSSYLIDSETRVLELQLRHAPVDKLELGFDFPIIWRGGGVLDSSVDWWHRTFGLPRGDRDRVEDNEFSLSGKNEDGSEFDLQGTGTRLGNVALHGKYLLTNGTRTSPAWSIRSALSLPTSSGSYGNDLFDLGFSLLGSKRWQTTSAYFGGGYVLFTDTKTDNLSFETHHFSAFSNLEYRHGDNTFFHLGLNISSALLKDVERFPDYALYLDIGFSYLINRNLAFEFLLRENPTPQRGTADVTFLFGLRYKMI